MQNFCKSLLLSLALVLCGGGMSQLYAQQRSIKGTVQDEKGASLPGVTIIVKGTTNGTTTGADGKFTLSIPKEETTLQFSYIGYQTQEVVVSTSQTELKVIMKEDVTQLEDVVVTAFATQKKINVTGAITQVSGSDLVATPVSNIANALIGSTPGVSGLQTSGEPGRNAADIKIRGISTYGSSTPLVVIDGIEQAAEQGFSELNSMDPNEIENISVLKDASSTAVFGIRGANGVILVTTKRGRVGKPVINFSANYGFTQATELQEGLTSYEYALLRNESIRNEQRGYAGQESLNANIYDDYDLWKFKNNRDFTPMEVDAMTHLTAAQKEALKNSPALYYGSHNLYKEQFDRLGPQAQVNLNVSGGTERVKYFVSFGYFNQKGITNVTEYYGAQTGSKFDRYNFRSNFDINVAKNWKVTLNSSAQFGQTQGPGSSADPYDISARYKIIMQYIYDANPLISPGFVEGKLVSGFNAPAGSIQKELAAKTASSIGDQNAVYNLLTSGMGTIYNSLLDNSVRVDHTMDYLIKGLKAHGTVSYQDNYNRYVNYKPSIPSYSVRRSDADPNVYEFFGGSLGAGSFNSYGYSNWNKLYIEGGFDWAGSFNGHNISALLLGKASRYTMPGGSFNVPSGIMGLVGRVTYNYQNRYMVEFNAGYNGTEQFAEGKRFGFFPAYSIGWVPTEEEFFPKNDILTFLKIRGSYGEVGNDQLGSGRRYYYLPNTYNLNQTGYQLGNSNGSSENAYYAGATEGALGNPDITWERAKKYDVGVEIKMFKDRLSIVADWFKEDRNSILTTLGIIPGIYGVSASSVPPANVGKTWNKGYEIEVGWQDNPTKDISYGISANISYAKNKVVYKAEASNPYYWMNETGFSIGQRHGLVADGLFNTLEELANRPYNTFTSNKATLGDIRYKDLNGDGMIDNKDIAPIGYPNYPQYHYNIKANFAWKGLSINLLFSGTANGSFQLPTAFVMPFFKSAGNAWRWEYDGRWTPERYAAGAKITYPRVTYNPTPEHTNYRASSYWIKSNDFFKLKNVEIGYTFNTEKGLLKNWNIQRLKVFAQANNVYTFKNPLRDYGIDPETTDGSAYIFPLTRVITFGVSLQF